MSTTVHHPPRSLSFLSLAVGSLDGRWLDKRWLHGRLDTRHDARHDTRHDARHDARLGATTPSSLWLSLSSLSLSLNPRGPPPPPLSLSLSQTTWHYRVVGDRVESTLTEEAALADFGKLRAMTQDALKKVNKDWSTARKDKGSTPLAPTPDKLELVLGGPKTGQLLAEYFHWQSRHQTQTNKSSDNSAFAIARGWTRSQLLKAFDRDQKHHRPRDPTAS